MANSGVRLIVDNVRSAYNVGSLFRSAEVFGASEVILTGISPYPEIEGDSRSPQVIERNNRLIAKTALDAQKLVPYRYVERAVDAITELRAASHQIYALEQSQDSVPLDSFRPKFPCALIVGHELNGVGAGTLSACDAVLEIPQYGRKESLNVAVAGGIALYHLVKLG